MSKEDLARLHCMPLPWCCCSKEPVPREDRCLSGCAQPTAGPSALPSTDLLSLACFLNRHCEWHAVLGTLLTTRIAVPAASRRRAFHYFILWPSISCKCYNDKLSSKCGRKPTVRWDRAVTEYARNHAWDDSDSHRSIPAGNRIGRMMGKLKSCFEEFPCLALRRPRRSSSL
jgi:hypothetical protein